MMRARKLLIWAAETFGIVARDREERVARLVEEVLELAQVEGLSPLKIMRMVARVYEKEPGDIRRELGQVGMTLEMLAANAGYDLDELTQAESDRVQSIPKEEWTRRHAAKVAIGIAAS